jgi:hypothetical protein
VCSIVVRISWRKALPFRQWLLGEYFRLVKSLLVPPVMLFILHAVWLVICKECMGSMVNFKTRLANYKSRIKHNKRTCSIVNHFLDCHGADHSLLKFMLIDRRLDKVWTN